MPALTKTILQFKDYLGVFLQILAATLFLIGTILLARSLVPIHPEYEDSDRYMPYKFIKRRYKAGLFLNFLGFILLIVSNILKFF